MKSVKEIHLYEPTFTGIKYDVALLELWGEVDFSRFPKIRPICLQDPDDDNTFDGSLATVAGWGHTHIGGPSSNTLLKTELEVISNDVCK